MQTGLILPLVPDATGRPLERQNQLNFGLKKVFRIGRYEWIVALLPQLSTRREVLEGLTIWHGVNRITPQGYFKRDERHDDPAPQINTFVPRLMRLSGAPAAAFGVQLIFLI